MGQTAQKVPAAAAGDTVALGRLDMARTGDAIATGKPAKPLALPPAPAPVMALAVHARDRKDDVKLSAAMQKLVDEDPSLIAEQNASSAR